MGHKCCKQASHVDSIEKTFAKKGKGSFKGKHHKISYGGHNQMNMSNSIDENY